jgi:alpha-amylase
VPQICLYFQLHQPYRLGEYSVFDIGQRSGEYFASEKSNDNRKIFRKVSQKSYVPMLKLLLKLLKQHQNFNFAISASGIFLEQAKLYSPEVLKLLKQLAQTHRVEFLAETYYHSLSSLYSPEDFRAQVAKHHQLIKTLFNQHPIVFRNTELIYSNDIARQVAELGYVGILTEAVGRYLGGRRRTQVFKSYTETETPLLLKHAELSDDLAFRFSDRNWRWFPLNSSKYLNWMSPYADHELINLFMDFETFGGIFEFFEHFVGDFLKHSWNKFVLPGPTLSTAQKNLGTIEVYDVPDPISWADVDRDLTAWIDNPLQKDSLKQLYQLEAEIKSRNDENLMNDWRCLQTSDHFYYMCTKWAADGDVHAYFSPYTDPYEAYQRYSIVLADLKERLLD